jgi:hypothetical protein
MSAGTQPLAPHRATAIYLEAKNMTANRTAAGAPQSLAGEENNGTAEQGRSRHLLPPTIAIVALLIIAIGFTGYVEKWLWMRQIDYIGIFWTLLSVQ